MESVWGRTEWGQWIESFPFKKTSDVYVYGRNVHICEQMNEFVVNCAAITAEWFYYAALYPLWSEQWQGVVLEAISIRSQDSCPRRSLAVHRFTALPTDNPAHGWTLGKRKHLCQMVVSIWLRGLSCWAPGLYVLKEDRIRPRVDTAEINLVSAVDVEKRTHRAPGLNPSWVTHQL